MKQIIPCSESHFMLSTDMGNKRCLRARYDGLFGPCVCFHESLPSIESVLSVRMILYENLDFTN